ncbi:MAG: DUF6483 family protein [Anaerolineae bacterium]|jgi:hypothetical protein
MLRDDYIMRLVAQFTRFLTEIIGLRRGGQNTATLTAIDQALQDLLDLDGDAVREMTAGDLVNYLTLGESPILGRDKCIFLATLLREMGHVFETQKRPADSYHVRQKALDVMLSEQVVGGGLGLPEYAPTVDGLVADLSEYRLPQDTAIRLMRHYEQLGQFARAEDVLFDMLEAQPDDAELIALGTAFYHRLLTVPDALLAAGHLPRDEVEAGLAELQESAASDLS